MFNNLKQAVFITFLVVSSHALLGQAPKQNRICANAEVGNSKWSQCSRIQLKISQNENQPSDVDIRFFSRNNAIFEISNPKLSLAVSFMLIDGCILAHKGLPSNSDWFDSFESLNLSLNSVFFGLQRLVPAGPSTVKAKSELQSGDTTTGLRFSTPGDCHLEINAPWRVMGTIAPAGEMLYGFDFILEELSSPPESPISAEKIKSHFVGNWNGNPPPDDIPSNTALKNFVLVQIGGPEKVGKFLKPGKYLTIGELKMALRKAEIIK